MSRVESGAAPKLRAEMSLVVVAFIWGASFVIVKEALDDISTLLFLALRFTLAAAALAVILGPNAKRPGRGVRDLRGGVLAGTCLFAGYVLQTFGLKYTSPSKTGFLTGLYIPLVPILGAFVYRKAPRLTEVAGIGAAGLGMALMTVQGSAWSMGRGDLLVIGCAFAYALHILVLAHFTRGGNIAFLSIAQIATAAALSLATCGWAEPVRFRPSGRVWVALAVTSLLATALAFSLQTWAQQYSSATRTALIFALEPVFAWLTSFALSGELLTARATLGAVLILAGIVAVEWKPAAVGMHPSG